MSSITVHTSAGTRVYQQPSELHAEIGKLYLQVNRSNEAAARAYFALGELLVKSHEQIKTIDPKASVRHLIHDSGIHPQKAKRAIKWYKALRDPEDGAFSMHLYRNAAHEVVEAVKSGSMNASIDEQGKPSVKAMANLMGLNGPAARRACLGVVEDTRVPDSTSCLGGVEVSAVPEHAPQLDDDDGFRVMDVLNALPSPTGEDLDELDELAGETSPKLVQPTLTPTVRPSVNPGASGAQMTIDFDLVAREGELRKSIEIVAAKLAQGRLDNAHAAGIDQRLQALTQYVNATIEEDVA